MDPAHQPGRHPLHPRLRPRLPQPRHHPVLFDVFVETQLINTAPSITSSPISSAIVGRPYAYTLRASDPDAGDLLTYFFNTAPFGMGIHPTTGVLSWTPSLAQTGPTMSSLASATWPASRAFSRSPSR
ncbi:MAG: hypothetical protein IPJ98_20960 [Bryobacterales bacterium]|nr:hypothetical protein [Bryobacterales bacterium]